MKIGKIIRKHRKKNGWTLHQLAKILGVSHTYVCLIESGERNPGIKTMYRICDEFGLEKEWEKYLKRKIG